MLFQKDRNGSIVELGKMHGASGYVAESVPLALFAASKLGLHSFEEILTSLIECGGDTDTNASIAGQVMGAALGANELPSLMLEKLRGMQDWNLILDLTIQASQLSP